jgi:hypothetical protein
MFCHNCGKEISSYTLCDSELFAEVSPAHYDKKTGIHWYLIDKYVSSLEEAMDRQPFACEKWGHSPVAFLACLDDANIPYMKPKPGSPDGFNTYVPESVVKNGLVSGGPCIAKCCPYCGALEQEKKGGCYIASVVFEDYNSSEVFFLRGFRDNYLRNTILGRVFILIYYSIASPLAKLISKNNSLMKFVKFMLLKLISFLKSRISV